MSEGKPPPPTQTSSTDGEKAGNVSSSSISSSKKEKKAKPVNSNVVIPPKKPKLTKAERRAIQEAQRAAKAAGAGGGAAAAATAAGAGGPSQHQQPGKKPKQQQGIGGTAPDGGGGGKKVKGGKTDEKKSGGASGVGADDGKKEDDKTLSVFSHLPPFRNQEQYDREFSGVILGSSGTSVHLHPEVLSLGLKYADGKIRGGNARCKAMLRAFQSVLRDYRTPPDCKDMRYDLDHNVIKPTFQYWTTKCRPHSVSMGNAFTFLKTAVASLERDMDEAEAKETLCETIDAYIRERIYFADKAISKHVSSKIVDGDVILTYAKSEVIEVLLKDAAVSKNFRVIVVDSRPLLEGRVILERLADAGIECTYIMLNSLSYVMREVTKVFLGAAALMSDGSVFSRVGTACVALMARSNNVPVLFCCETYKISARVQLESITGNELGNPDDVATTSCSINRNSGYGNGWIEGMSGLSLSGGSCAPLADWRETPNLRLLNLLYDLTPSEFVSGIVTEMGILPPTSVAVLLREMNPQDNDSAFKGA